MKGTTATVTGSNVPQNNIVAEPWHHVHFERHRSFVRRRETLVTLRHMLFVQQVRGVALVGLGGVGKTQVALELASWTKENQADYSVFWVPALS
ncbi:hypothetical protein GE09DRAFT_1232399 [Coniochaeta sp. 2T2.1]|nr:hypothetical protein GE09DRAFT_1232399 [Coniochaeta sp. 2T2.1]